MRPDGEAKSSGIPDPIPLTQTVIAPTLVGALKEATRRYGPGNFVFKIGERSVGKWRWLTIG